jgi:hypothetical protein
LATNQLGIKVSNAIIPYASTLKQTKQVALTVGTVTTSAGDVSNKNVRRAVAIFYQGTDGAWRMRFNVRVTFTALTCVNVTVPITGVLFSNAAGANNYQSISCFLDVVAPIQSFAYPNTANLYATLPSTSIQGATFSGDVELESEPTAYTTAANMEGVLAASVYIPEASASVAGLVGTGAQTFAGVKTFDAGIVCGTGNGTIAAIKTGTWTPTFTSTGWTFTNKTGYYTRVGDRVTCWGYTDAAGTGSGTLVIDLPIAPTAFTNSGVSRGELSGALTTDGASSYRIMGTPGGTTAVVYPATGASGLGFHFSYRL